MPDIMKRLGRDVLVVDGAMGTMLQRAGLPAGECPELINVTAPEMVADVHRLYRLAGADCATTNTFGGTATKLAEYGLSDRVAELNVAAVRIALAEGGPHVLADIGPTGLLMEPLGSAAFDEVFSAFAEQAAALASAGPDAILIETMTDIAEARCAVLAARSVTDLPVFVSCAFGLSGRMELSGTDPETAAVVLAAAGADAVGMNCGLGPEEMLPLLRRTVAATSLPVIAQPNAGLPRLDDSGATVFPGTPSEMGAFAAAAVDAGVAVVGSCCGSTPVFTGAIIDSVADKPVAEVPGRGFEQLVVAGPRKLVTLGGSSAVRVIGERINPTGREILADELRAGSMSMVRSLAAEQRAAGADMLDVNVGAAGVDASTMLPAAALAVAGTTDLPLVLDTTDPAALEAALRVYPGRALINSVNGDPASLDAVLPLAAKYGAAVVILALDDTGIPETAEGRLAVVDRVRGAAHEAGLDDRSLVVDALVMTAATDAQAPRTTVAALEGAHARGLPTVLGISNVSHGLPNRALLNGAFIGVAASAGLDAGIVNPNDHVIMEAISVANQERTAAGEAGTHAEPARLDEAWQAWEGAYAAALEAAAASAHELTSDSSVIEPTSDAGVLTPAESNPRAALESALLRGDTDAAPVLVDALVEEDVPAESIIGDVLTPAIQRLGDAFGRGEVFLPQMMIAADAMKAAVARVKQHLPEGSADRDAPRVAFATVKGDIHSIGKDICVSLLESQGFEVADLGVDVPVESVLDGARDVDAVCLSALMTTTLPAMQDTVEAVRDQMAELPVFVGGAVVTAEWAGDIGAAYASDAPGCVNAVREAITAQREGRA